MKCDNKSSAAFFFSVCLAACGDADGTGAENPEERGAPAPTCSTLFGQPGENTGLSEAECMPRCASCEAHGSFVAPEYSSEDLMALRELTHENPPELLETSPYSSPEDYVEAPDHVCGLLLEPEGAYTLETFSSVQDAEDAGALITHEGACGACSSLQDLAVYIEVTDLTTPVRQCGLQHLTGTVEQLAECISQLGFSPACSQIWAFNSQNTRQLCLQECVSTLDAPYHQEDGSPNACIRCDEEKSGPVFKAVSGRTRRNSGLPTALCRPCEGLAMIDHHYFAE